MWLERMASLLLLFVQQQLLLLLSKAKEQLLFRVRVLRAASLQTSGARIGERRTPSGRAKHANLSNNLRKREFSHSIRKAKLKEPAAHPDNVKNENIWLHTLKAQAILESIPTAFNKDICTAINLL
jgi:hypothetical protein